MTRNSDLVSSVFPLNKFHTYIVSKADFFIYISPAQSILLINCILLQRKYIVEYGPLLQYTKIVIISLSHYIETSQLICRANQLTEYSCFQKCE